MKRIILHWTVGTYQPNKHEFDCYHYLINGDGLVIKGRYQPEDNLDCKDGKYAQHCGGGNTGSIGIALCGMCGYKDRQHLGPYPLKRIQYEKAYELMAQLCHKYNIPITKTTVLTHMEFGNQHPSTTSHGKIDVSIATYDMKIQPAAMGNHIREKVNWYYKKNEV